VLKDVPPRTTVAGVPAREIGFAGCEEPALAMDQFFQGEGEPNH
jgi:serine O-acetyltransferase